MNYELKLDVFSQSVNVGSLAAKQALTSKFERKKDLDLNAVQNYDPSINKEISIKYALNKIIMDIEKSIKELDMKKFKAPFLPFTFHTWRFLGWNKLEKLLKNNEFGIKQQWRKKFIASVDDNLLIKFFHNLKEPYFNLVFFEHYQIPIDIKNAKLKENNYLYADIMNFSNHIANWCCQIELAADLIQRAELYGLYEIPEKKQIFIKNFNINFNSTPRKEILNQLTSNFKAEKKFNVQGFTHRILNIVLIKSMKLIASFIYGKGLGFQTLTYSGALAILYWVVGSAAFPWTMFISKLQIPWLLGGLCASKGLDKISELMDSNLILNDIKELTVIFDHIGIYLSEFNEICKKMILNCFGAINEEDFKKRKEELIKTIDDMLVLNVKDDMESIEKKNMEFANLLTFDMLSLKEHEDWIIVQPKTLKEENVDNGFVKFDYQD